MNKKYYMPGNAFAAQEYYNDLRQEQGPQSQAKEQQQYAGHMQKQKGQYFENLARKKDFENLQQQPAPEYEAIA
jgi:hypothetical protein